MKKKMILLVGFLLFDLIILMIYLSINSLNRKDEISQNQELLSKIYRQLGISNINKDRPTAFIYFNSECEHCQREMEEIEKNISSFKDFQLVLISFEPQSQAIQFLDNYNLSELYIASSPEKVMSAFTGGVPQTLIYKKGKLIKHFRGEVKIEAILKYLKK